MCLALYLASDIPLRTSTWSQEAPAPYLGALYEGKQDRLRRHCSKEYIFVVGSDTNCCCGFNYDSNYPDADGNDPDAEIARRWLVETVRDALRQQQTVEILACWSGDESEPVLKRANVYPDALADRRILNEGYLLIISEIPLESITQLS